MTKHVNLDCSFCGKNQREVKKLIAGPSVYICDECIKAANDLLQTPSPEGERAQGAAVVLLSALQAHFSAFEGAGVPQAQRERLRAALTEVEPFLVARSEPSPHLRLEEQPNRACSFCGKPRSEVSQMLAGAATAICSECVGLCNDIIAEEIDREDAREASLDAKARALEHAEQLKQALAGFEAAGVPERHRVTLGAVAEAIRHFLETGED